MARKALRPLALLTWFVAFVSFVVGAFLLRGHLLDDTFIHLRYAEHLSRTGELAYNEGEPSFGTSALPYVIFFGNLARWLPRELLPLAAKWLSVACHGALLVVLAWRAHRMFRRGATTASLWMSAFALAVAMPATGRWLQDGMETSLAVLLAVIAAVAPSRLRRSPSHSVWIALLCGLAAAAPGILRIDMVPISVASLGLALAYWRERDRTEERAKRGLAIPMAITGAWLAVLLVMVAVLFLQTGHVVSDSAVAKQKGELEPRFVLEFLYSMASVSPVWLLGAGVLLLRLRKPTAAVIFGLFPIAAVVGAGTIAGQYIHGARYFLPALAFAWVTFAEQRSMEPDAPRLRLERLAVPVALALTMLHTAVVARPLAQVTRPLELRLETLPGLDDTALIAAHDIGHLGWLTNARVLDLAGLVNGRRLATEVRPKERLCKAADEMDIPAMLILTEAQAEPRRTGDVIELRCERVRASYVRRAEPVMVASNLKTPIEWFAWELVRDDSMPIAEAQEP